MYHNGMAQRAKNIETYNEVTSTHVECIVLITIKELYGDYNFGEFNKNSQLMIFLLTKQTTLPSTKMLATNPAILALA